MESRLHPVPASKGCSCWDQRGDPPALLPDQSYGGAATCWGLSHVPCLVVVGLVPPMRRGFYCNDSSIRYPCRAPVPPRLAMQIALGESYRIHSLRLGSRSFIPNPYVAILYKEIGAFLFGCTVGQSLTNMAKITVGRLRPHFLAVCRPDLALLNCSRGYVEDYNPGLYLPPCRKSFYSGHASFAMYSMTYLVFYLQARLTWRGARLLRPLLQFVLLLLALYTGLTRISDYWHHPSDVAMGFLQGALIAYWVVSETAQETPPASALEQATGRKSSLIAGLLGSQPTSPPLPWGPSGPAPSPQPRGSLAQHGPSRRCELPCTHGKLRHRGGTRPAWEHGI
uniref:Phosphatidic acid phosphatase type 2/haloperoxidase domain-containing protein n=1 Tax=Gopherus evgoodei TaxID=1825980 RepID=A0A8C4YUC2_9SAUR